MDRHVDGFTEVYDWICHLQFTFKNAGSTEALELTRIDGKIISVHACSHEKGNVVLGLWCDKVCLVDLGECRIGECSEEAMQENLLPLFSDICVYGFFQVTDQGIADFELPPIGCNVLLAGLKKLKKHVLSSSRSQSEEEEMLLNEADRQKIACKDTDELQRLDIGLGTIESAKFRPAFNSIFRAASYSHLLHAKTQFSANVVLELQKLAEQTQKETLVIIGPDATHLLMKYLAAKFTEIRLRHGSESIKSFKMSYSTGLSGFSTINAYCPRLSMQLQLPPNQDKRKDADLELALSRHVMHCFIHLCHKVSVFTDWIDVEFQIDNLRCQAFPFNTNKPFPSHLENEWYFPAKIALTLSPEPASDVHAFSLGASSQNPEVSVTRERIREVTLKAEQAMGIKFEPTLSAELKIGRKNSYTYKLNNWVFDLSSVNNTGGRLEWTLYDNSFGKPVFSYTPPQFNFFNGNTWSRGDYYKAFRAFAQEEGSVRPFTAGGGVVFAGDRYGIPMTWRLKRDLEGQTLKWIVEGEIWFAYYPNKYCTNRHMEIRSHKFREQVQLRLQQRNPGPYLI